MLCHEQAVSMFLVEILRMITLLLSRKQRSMAESLLQLNLPWRLNGNQHRLITKRRQIANDAHGVPGMLLVKQFASSSLLPKAGLLQDACQEDTKSPATHDNIKIWRLGQSPLASLGKCRWLCLCGLVILWIRWIQFQIHLTKVSCQSSEDVCKQLQG